MTGSSLGILNCSCLDPLHGVQFESRDLLIKDGVFRPLGNGRGDDIEKIDVGGRIVVPGGILPSYRIPVAAMQGLRLDPVASTHALIQAGFTTIIVDGITPFTALDVQQQLQRMPIVNKASVIDVANFQLLTGFLKSGVVNYAAATASSLLTRFKGFGLSCIGPGSTLMWSSSHPVRYRSINDPLPFLNTSIEKSIIEFLAILGTGFFKPGIIVQTGIEGMPGSREQLDGLLTQITGERKPGKTAPLVAMRHLTRYSLDPDYKGGDIAENVAATIAIMEGACSVAGLLDIPTLTFSDTVYIDETTSPLYDTRHVMARGIVEGELSITAYLLKEKEQQDLATRFWLSGLKLALDLPASLKERVAFSLMPQLIGNPTNLVSTMACLLSERYRFSQKVRFIDGTAQALAGELLKGKILTLEELVRLTRATPATMFGLEELLGGLGEGQLGDAIILNAKPGDLDRLLDEPDELQDLLCNPHAVIKGGRVVLKNGHMDAQTKGFTILHETQVDLSIAESIEHNIDKQFLKYYSTHIDAKTVPASFVEPAINS